jgi:hypothetical protein
VDPSPARFARLVTQLKWRLLEGQGQAYYEIGVADSGLLIGLTKHNLEKSIETLEEMAGEIGASVIIVKEVEVPDALVKLAEEAIRQGEVHESRDLTVHKLSTSFDDEDDLWRPRLGAWDRRSKRAEVLKSVDSFSSSTSTTATTSTTGTETETDEIPTDDDFLNIPPVQTFQALDFDDLLALDDATNSNDETDSGLFPFDPEVSPETFVTAEVAITKQPSDTSLSIASVFKLRPRRRRPPSTHTKPDKRQQKLDARTNYHAAVSRGATLLDTATTADSQLTKNERRRIARDRRRELKRQALLAGVAAATFTSSSTAAETVADLTEEVTVVVDDSVVLDGSAVAALGMDDDLSPSAINEVEQVLESVSTSSEPRLIVEALVVRKLSVGAATYGDFGFRFDFD